jgi:hypothetical protein
MAGLMQAGVVEEGGGGGTGDYDASRAAPKGKTCQ